MVAVTEVELLRVRAEQVEELRIPPGRNPPREVRELELAVPLQAFSGLSVFRAAAWARQEQTGGSERRRRRPPEGRAVLTGRSRWNR